ncbi:TPA: hypothetical protein ACGO4F_000178 [Streptococcus suis]
MKTVDILKELGSFHNCSSFQNTLCGIKIEKKVNLPEQQVGKSLSKLENLSE